MSFSFFQCLFRKITSFYMSTMCVCWVSHSICENRALFYQRFPKQIKRDCCTKVNLSLCNSPSFRIGADRRNNGDENLHLYRNMAHE